MPKDQSKPIARARTEDLRREIEQSGAAGGWKTLERPLRSDNFIWASIIWASFVVIVGTVTIWARQQPLVDAKRVMSETRTAGVRFSFADDAAKRQAESMARAKAPRVYVAVPGVIDEIAKGLESLPVIARDAASVEQVEPGIRQQFGLTDAALAALRDEIGDTEISTRWRDRVRAFSQQLAQHPLLDAKAAQLESQALNKEMELRHDGSAVTLTPSASAINVESPEIGQRLRQIAGDAGFERPLVDVVVARLGSPPKPTYTFDPSATAASQDAAAGNATPPPVTYPAGDVIYRRGELLTQQQLGVTSIIITHDLTCARETGNRVAMLLDGKFLSIGKFEEVFETDDEQIKSFYNYNFIQ